MTQAPPKYTPDQYRAMAARVQAIYVQRPELIQKVLEDMGAQHIKMKAGHFSSTCPVHGGDNPTACCVYFDQAKAPIWACFTKCGCRADFIEMVKRRWGMKFSDALGWLAARAGVSFDGIDGDVSDEDYEDLRISPLLREIRARSATGPTVFPESMREQSIAGLAGHAALQQYLMADKPNGRQLSWKCITRFELGYVPGGTWVKPKADDSNRSTGWFEDRLSTTWRMPDASLIGFAGRRLDGLSERKWQTLDGTKKQHSLYGCHLPEFQQSVANHSHLVLVEGYADVWRAWMHGVYQVVAVGGTHLSPQQVRLIGSLNPRRVLCMFDSDEAGEDANQRISAQLSTITNPAVVSVPAGMDPDDLVDPEDFRRRLSAARNAV